MSALPASATTPAPGRPEAGGVHASTPEERDESEARTIGRPGEPVRALTFSSGGIETAMQLGVVHALLVSRAQPPDMVLGVSAGAVNAVALAEVLQAGCDTADLNLEDRRDPLDPKVARFRQIFEDYQNCPHDLLDAMLPDAYQIDAEKPLKPLRLPVHAKAEREGRYKALNARAGLINFYNELLLLKIPIGTIARAVRRVLGIRGATEAAREAQGTIWALEFFRLLILAGTTLHQLAPVRWPFFRSAFTWRPWTVRHKEQGVTAARLIFRSRVWSQLRSQLLSGVSFLLLAAAWLILAFLVLAVATVIGQLPLRVFPAFVDSIGGIVPAIRDLSTFLLALPGSFEPKPLAGHVPVLGAIVISMIVFTLGYALISAVVLKEPRGPALQEALGATGIFLLLLAVWGVALVAFASAIAFLIDLALEGLDKVVPWIRMPFPEISARGVLILIFGAAVLVVGTVIVRRRRLPLHLLARYGLADSLLHPHPLRQFFVRLFDPGYYGPVDMDSVVDRALRREEEPAPPPDKDRYEDHRKYLRDYWTKRTPPIHVALTVANVSTGKLSVVPGDVPTVDGLMAATAAAPFFPPVPLRDGLYIDAANVATQTTEALMNYLRHRLVKEATEVHVYNVSSLPLSKAELDSEQGQPAQPDGRPVAGQYTQLVEVIGRALQVQRFRDAYLNQKLVNLLTRVLPPGGAVWTPPKKDEGDNPDPYVRASVYPIEPEAPLNLVRRFTKAGTPRERRRIIAETVADGCRAALETMLSHQIRSTARANGKQVVPVGDGTQALPCASVIAAHNLTMNEKRGFPGSAAMPEKDEQPGPGLVEVCRNCALHRGGQDTTPRHLVVPERQKAPPDWHLGDRITHEHPARLSDVAPLPVKPPATGVQDNGARQTIRPSGGRARAKDEQEIVDSLRAWHRHRQELGKAWPRARGDVRGDKRATVSLLFSGGVFRGVYQMGVLNALNLAGMRPDLIAGASVGSITAAMVARVFREPHDRERMARIARLAATYLALDRLILTDRFADFIRGFTVRAAGTRFSLSQMDRVFRTFDRPSPDRYNRELRAVAAGLERLFYVSPFELRELVEAARMRKPSEVFRLLADDLQEWLSRMGVGNQVLGAEPLAQLIAEHVLDGLPGYSPEHPGGVPFDVFCDDGIYLLATATNLGRGRLEVLGERPDRRASESRATLLDALLASSAFPGVFRPRWAWEVMPGARSEDQYIDGGVTDNLPLDAVAQFLHRASLARMVAARPGEGETPHLLLCASLEPRMTVLNAAELKAVGYNWPGLWRRAAQLGYNKKIDLYSEIQQAIRQVMRVSTTHPASWTPLDLEVMAVKPEWLCSTFGFHPMLGFRRERQAMSIAHGCASTLLELARARSDDRSGTWKAAWGIDESRIPEPAVANRPDEYVPLKVGRDECWFKPGVTCPFSRTGLSELGLTDQTRREVETIYKLCGRHQTHRPTI